VTLTIRAKTMTCANRGADSIIAFVR
jgi:hypothetical protein